MLLAALLYLVLGFGGLTALAIMILKIGGLIQDCPQTQARARMASVTVATGFAAIGAGGVILIGALLPLLSEAPLNGLFVTLGLAALCLGLGFTHAVATLRVVVIGRPTPDQDDEKTAGKAPA